MFKKITTVTILFCFLLNTFLSGNAFSRETQNDIRTTLATASGYTELIGIEHKDALRVKQAILAKLICFKQSRQAGMSVEVTTLQTILGQRKKPDNTIYQPLDTNIFYPELTRHSDGLHVMCRRHDDKHGTRTYYAVFHLFPNDHDDFLPIKVYTQKQYEAKQEMSPKDQDIIDRYSQHEDYDEHVIKWAHDEDKKGNLTIVERDISKDMDEILKTANITIDDTDNPIRKRKCYLVPLTEKAKKRIKKYKTTVIDINDKKIEVPTYSHSSNHAIHMFMEQELIDLLDNADKSNPNTKVAINYFRYNFAYEMGPMVGHRPEYPEIRTRRAPEFVFSGATLYGYGLNEISDKFYYGLSLGDSTTDLKSYKIVDLDTNLADRDYAMGRDPLNTKYQQLKEALESRTLWQYLFLDKYAPSLFLTTLENILKEHGLESKNVCDAIRTKMTKYEKQQTSLLEYSKEVLGYGQIARLLGTEDKIQSGLTTLKKELITDVEQILKDLENKVLAEERIKAAMSTPKKTTTLRTILTALGANYSIRSSLPEVDGIFISNTKAQIFAALIRLAQLDDEPLIKEIAKKGALWNGIFATLDQLTIYASESSFQEYVTEKLNEAARIAQEEDISQLAKALPIADLIYGESDLTAKTLKKAILRASISLSKKVGIKIARPVSDYTIFTLPGLYKNDEFSKDQNRFGARFKLELLEADNPKTIAKNIDTAISGGTLPANIMVQLPETMDKQDIIPLNALAARGVRFMTVRTEGLTDVNSRIKRLTYRRNVYSIMLLARNITKEDISEQTITYQLFKIFLNSLLSEDTADRTQTVTDYINNLTANQLQNIVNTILLWRKPEKVAAPDPEAISKILMSA